MYRASSVVLIVVFVEEQLVALYVHICICVCCYSSSRLVVYVPSISSIVLYSKMYGRVYVFPFRDDVFLPCDQGLEFHISLREKSINQY